MPGTARLAPAAGASIIAPMKTLLRALAALSFAVPGLAAAEDTDGLQNDANNPLTPKMAVMAHNYVQPVLSGQPGSGTNQLFMRGLLPHDALGVDQLMRVSLPVISNAWAPHHAANGIGDLIIYDMAIHRFDRNKIGVGPLLVAPTASSPALGSGKWQGGLQTVISLPHKWGLTAALTSYQQAFDGSLQTLTVQPLVFYNLDNGYYLRSSGISTFDLGRSSVVPIGLGLGRVFERPGGKVLNLFIEPQYSVVQTGIGVPSFQVFAGLVLQIPVKTPARP
jgi:hypothetical protein